MERLIEKLPIVDFTNKERFYGKKLLLIYNIVIQEVAYKHWFNIFYHAEIHKDKVIYIKYENDKSYVIFDIKNASHKKHFANMFDWDGNTPEIRMIKTQAIFNELVGNSMLGSNMNAMSMNTNAMSMSNTNANVNNMNEFNIFRNANHRYVLQDVNNIYDNETEEVFEVSSYKKAIQLVVELNLIHKLEQIGMVREISNENKIIELQKENEIDNLIERVEQVNKCVIC